MKLSTRLIALVVLTLLPLVGTQIYDEIDVRRQRAAEGQDQALRLVRLVANEQSKIVDGTRQLLTAIGRAPVVRGHDAAACAGYFADLIASYPQFVSLAAYDRTGRVACAGGSDHPAPDIGDRGYFHAAIDDGRFTIGEYVNDEPSGTRFIPLLQPYSANGQTAGVVVAEHSVDWLNREFARNPLPPKATVSAIDRTGTILARFPETARFVGTKIAPQSHTYMLSGEEGVREALGFDGIARIYSYTPLPGGPPGMTLSIGLDKAELLKGAQDANRRDIVAIAGSSVLALLLAWFGARIFIGGPIQTLLGAAERWRRGELGVRVAFPEARSEFGRLGAAFDTMAAAMGAREQELERRVQERTDALKTAMEAHHAAEAELHEARKMETIGRLTGGVAHDFNNLLAAIVGNIELARFRLDGSHPAMPRLDAAMESAARGATLVQQLLAFARRQNLRPEVVDLNRRLRDSRDILQRLLRSDVTVAMELAAPAWMVRVDPGQLEAAILNLAINARDAMPNGGVLRLTTRNVHHDDDVNPAGLAGEFVALTVADTGSGMSPEVLEKVFEPFFTTKEVGAGSGLGLSMVQGFVRQSAGAVSIDSQVGRGSAVTLYLPRTTDPISSARPAVPEPVRGQGTVLLADDDDRLRSVMVPLLEHAGFSVIAATGGRDALARFQRDGHRIDIVVSDLVMPDGLDGAELAAEIRRRRPGFPILLITGYGEALSDETLTATVPVLMKPFEHTVLAAKIRELLATRVPAVTMG